MAPLLRTKPGARTEIAGNNERLAAIGEPIPEGFIHEEPTKPSAYRVQSA